MQADECQNLADVRYQIDLINNSILVLLAKRQKYVERAAQLKKDISEAPAPARRAQIIEKITQEAAQLGLDTNVATAVFNSMIDAFIALEQKNILKHANT